MRYELPEKTVALLVTDGFEQEELTSPREALEKAGAQPRVVSIKRDSVKGWKKGQWGDSFPVDVHIDDADAGEFDALVLPGGVMNPDKLRMNPRAVSFVRDFFEQHKPVAAICHGPQMLIEAGVVRGRTLTSYWSIQTDLENAGAHWVDQEVVVDDNLVTSRSPDDLPAFDHAMIRLISSGMPLAHRR